MRVFSAVSIVLFLALGWPAMADWATCKTCEPATMGDGTQCAVAEEFNSGMTGCITEASESITYRYFPHGGCELAQQWSMLPVGCYCNSDYEASRDEGHRVALIALPGPKSRGTYDTIRRARLAGIPVIVRPVAE